MKVNHKSLIAAAVCGAAVWLVIGCGSPEQKARELFGEGKYEEVISKYPDSPMAEQAKEKLAEKLFNEGKYDEVVKTYGQTPIAGKAQEQLNEQAAKKLFDAKDYEGILKQYPKTQIAVPARDSLFKPLRDDPDKWEKLQAQYPPTGDVRNREIIASQQLDRIMTYPKKKKIGALETFLQDPKYQSTLAAAKARKELATAKKG